MKPGREPGFSHGPGTHISSLMTSGPEARLRTNLSIPEYESGLPIATHNFPGAYEREQPSAAFTQVVSAFQQVLSAIPEVFGVPADMPHGLAIPATNGVADFFSTPRRHQQSYG